jgi:hypothetical protein
MIHVGLLVVQDVLGTPLPAEIVARAGSDGNARVLAKQACVYLRTAAPEPPSSARQWLFYLQARERWHDRLNGSLRLVRVLGRHALNPARIRLLLQQAGARQWLLPP